MDTNQINTRFKGLDRKVNTLSHYVAELQRAELQRKSRGITRANRGVVLCECKLAQLTEEVAGLHARFNNLGPAAGPAQNEAILAELKRIDGRVDSLWSDLNAELEKLRERVDGHDKRLDAHDEQFDTTKAQLASQGQRIEGVEVRVDSHATAIANLRQQVGTHHVNPIAWVLGIIAGIVAGWAWAVHDWAQETTINGVKTVVENTAANSWWAATACGVGVGLVVFFLASMLIPSGDDENETTATATADAGAGARVVIDRNAPTTAVPVVNAPPPPPVANQHAGVR